jgi:HPt (histidine-containing phosphotransfer) domain-containing protein
MSEIQTQIYKDSDACVLDIDALKSMVDNIPELINELIRLYLENLPNLMMQIKQGISNKDCRLIEQSAHALKGMSFNVSAKRIADTALALEKTSRNNEAESAEQIYTVLEKNAEELTNTLLNALKS